MSLQQVFKSDVIDRDRLPVWARSFWFIKGFYLALISVNMLGRIGVKELEEAE